MSYKHILNAFLAASCLFFTLVLIACSDDEGEDQVEENKVELQEIIYEVSTPVGTSTGKRLLYEVANITIHLSDSDGANVQKTIKNGAEQISIKRSVFPYNCRFYTTVSLKPNATIDPNATYFVNLKFVSGYYTSYAGYSSLPGQHYDDNEIAVDVKGDKLKNYIANLGEQYLMNFSFDDNGEPYIR